MRRRAVRRWRASMNAVITWLRNPACSEGQSAAERNNCSAISLSGSMEHLISQRLQMLRQFLQCVSVAAGDRVGRFPQHFGDFEKRHLFPDFEDDDFRLS